MNSIEIVPIVSGLLLGIILGCIEPASRKRIGLPMALAFGFLATVVSGEFRVSWSFLLVDIPLVAVSTLVGLVALYGMRWSRVGLS